MDYLSSLQGTLDNPNINWKGIVLGFSVGQYLFETILNYRQYKVLQRTAPPAEIGEFVDDVTFNKSQDYGRAKARFGFVSDLYGLVQNSLLIKYNVLPKIYSFAGCVLKRFAPVWLNGAIPQSIFMFLGLGTVSTLISLPLSIYSTFVLEEKYGFNKQTPKIFITDLFKSQLLSWAIAPPLMTAFLKIIDYFGNKFFFYLWVFFLMFQFIAITVYPTLIQPLFNKLEPLEDGELKDAIEALALRVNFPLKKLYVIDGSKRSGHSNAYFYGLPWSKQIVLYDTLIEQCNKEEVVAILGHEIGHWAESHVTKMLVGVQIHIFSIFVLFSSFFKNNSFYQSFGFAPGLMPVLAGFALFNDVLSPLESVVQFLMNIQSRKAEYEADAYASKLGYGHGLRNGLVKIHKENLGTMNADWIFSAYHHSHPILPHRLAALGLQDEKQVRKEK
ncbi:hypothetical protein NADFUDRAFT_82021 [Nadsonia fulvescens var. elongata DSM 6958]|uniref:CAAX prenyl protease n=1 Tax=Nadsonia fulvescens var. elongata DSM 6958 TaxID=857566 RepID=A0A1E3PQR3_9ASCO|nr:hypothetical protein NADFUDRAFT_82021 [Nadsonia fulvescens var. elongata DSM 6958]